MKKIKKLDHVREIYGVDNKSNHNSMGETIGINYEDVVSIVSEIKNKLSCNRDILQLNPDAELTKQILTSSILSPNSIVNTTMSYRMNKSPVGVGVSGDLLSIINDHIKDVYDLEGDLSTILDESLFTKGAHIRALIPRHLLPNVKQVAGVEGYARKGKLLELMNDSVVGTEDYGDSYLPERVGKSGIIISDDIGLLSKSGLFIDDDMDDVIMEDYCVGLEDMNGVTFIDKLNDEESRPLAITLNPTSTIPIRGEGTEPIAYICVIDEISGGILSDDDINGNINSFRADYDTNQNIIRTASRAFSGITNKVKTLENMRDVYASLVLRDLRDNLVGGKLGNSIDVDVDNDVFQVLLIRKLQDLKTKLLIIPAQLVVYYAFEYRDNGTGLSLLEKSSMLYSMRGVNLFARLTASLDNSINITKVSAVINPDDPDARHTRSRIRAEAIKSKMAKYPFGINKAKDISNWVQRYGMQFDIKHKTFPDIEFSSEDMAANKAPPDDDINDILTDKINMANGVTTDMLESAKSNLATKVISDNLLIAKRIGVKRNIFTKHLTRHVRLILKVDVVLRDRIREHLGKCIRELKRNNKVTNAYGKIGKTLTAEQHTAILLDLSRSVYVTLPELDQHESRGTKEALENFLDSLDIASEHLLSDISLPPELVGVIGDKTTDVWGAMKSVLVRNWMRDNNYLPELTDMMSLDEDGKPNLGLLESYMDNTDTLTKILIPFIKKLSKNAARNDSKLDSEESEVEPDITEGDNVEQ